MGNVVSSLIIMFPRLFLHIRLCWLFIRVFLMNGSRVHYFSQIGALYFDLESYQSAILYLKKSEELLAYPHRGYTEYNSFYLGYSYLNLGDLITACKYFENYLAIKPDDEQVNSTIGWCYEVLNLPDNALKYYLKINEYTNDNLLLKMGCALLLSELGNKKEALDQLDFVKENTNDSVVTEVAEAVYAHINGEFSIAIDKYTGARSNVESLVESTFDELLKFINQMLVKCFRETGEFDLVLEILRKANESNPKDVWSINSLALEYAEQEIHLDKALKLINQALDYQPWNSVFLDTKGWVLFKLGRKDEAIALIKKSLDFNEDNYEAREHLRLI